MTTSNKAKRIDWVCRILITLQIILVLRGYIVWLQTKYQLVSPFIPESTLYQISYPYIMTSLISSGFMIVSLWLYFIDKKIPSIVIAGVSLLLSEMWIYLFVK